MYGGNCAAEFFLSCLDLQRELTKANIGHDFLVTTNESLITRARNTSVSTFMKHDFEAMMFLDADIQFKAEDVAKLWNEMAENDRDIMVAAYPMKRPGSDVTAWKNGQLVKLDDLNGITEVDYAGTGFMLIRRRVFEAMEKMSPQSAYDEGNVGKCYAHFDTGVVSDKPMPEWKDRFYCSEDYWFCRKARNLGMKIHLDPSIRLGHVGRFVYT